MIDLKSWGRARTMDVLGINRRNLDHVFADYRPGKFRPLDDKLLAKARLEEFSIAVPETICVIRSRSEMNLLRRRLGELTELVLKPSRGWGGRGILVLERDVDGWRTPGGHRYSEEELVDHAMEILVGVFSLDEAEDAVLVESRIRPHSFQTQLYPAGLSDLRVVLNHGEPIQAMLRVPTDRSDGKANLHEGGLGLGLDLENGKVCRAIQKGARIQLHPDTGIELEGIQLPFWDECLALARRTAEAFSEIDYLGVDIVLDERRGPLVLEVNARPGLAIQLANGGRQPVEPLPQLGRLERATVFTSWLVLLALACAPFVFDQWRQHLTLNVERIAVEAAPAESPVEEDEADSPVEWTEAAISLSSRSPDFADARAAAASGDQERALDLYATAALDSTVAPFAWNNMALIHRARRDFEKAEALLLKALQVHPDYERGMYNLALVERDLGHRDDAMKTLQVLLEQDPSHGRAWGELGELYLARGEPDAAIAPLNRAIRFEPTLASYRRALGAATLAAGFPGLAAEAYGQALALRPDSRAAAAGWIESRLELAALDPPPLSEATRDSLDDLAGRVRRSTPLLAAECDWLRAGPLAAEAGLVEASSHEPRALRLRELAQLEAGRWSALEGEEFEDWRHIGFLLDRLDEEPERRGAGAERTFEDPRASILASWLHGRAPRPWALDAARSLDSDPAFQNWLDVVSSNESKPHAPAEVVPALSYPLRLRAAGDGVAPLPESLLLWSIGVGLRARGEDSQQWDSTLDELAPWFLPRKYRRFQLAISAGRWDEAHELGFDLKHNRVGENEIAFALIDVELRRGRESIARSLWDDLGPGEGNSPEGHMLHARLLLAEGKPKSAARRIDELLAIDPLNVEALTLHAEAMSARKKWPSAEKSLRRALDLQPDRIDIRERLARVLMAGRSHARAAGEWERILQLSTDSGLRRSALFNLALVRQRNGEYEASVALWDQFLEFAAQDYKGHFNRALALEALGRAADAAQGYETVLQLRPEHAAARQNLESLNGREQP